jgi:membrane protein YdbS with pleckstrin-like domain
VAEPGAKTYRPPAWWAFLVLIVILLLLLTAFAFISAYFLDPADKDGWPGLAMGIVAYVGAFALLLGVAEAKLVITHDGILVWRTTRRTTIPWDSIRRFDAGARAKAGPLTQVDVIMDDARRFAVSGTIGSRKRVAAIMAELSAAHHQHLAAQKP